MTEGSRYAQSCMVTPPSTPSLYTLQVQSSYKNTFWVDQNSSYFRLVFVSELSKHDMVLRLFACSWMQVVQVVQVAQVVQVVPEQPISTS